MDNDLKNKILNKYTNIYNKYFNDKKLQYSKIFEINDSLNYISYNIILDPGFGITLVLDDGDMRIMNYLLGCDFYNYGVSFNYTYIGYIMLLGETDYTLNIYDKYYDSFYENPKNNSLKILDNFLDILPKILQNYSDDIFISEDEKKLVFYINQNNIEKNEILFNEIEHEGFLVNAYFEYKFKTYDNICLIDLFNVEIPVYSEKRGKLVNPFYLAIFNDKTKEKKTYILDEEEFNIYDMIFEILSNNEIGTTTYITNPLLYEVLQNNKKTDDNIEFIYEPLEYSRYLEYFATFESIYNTCNENIDIEQLKNIIFDIEECDNFLYQYFKYDLDEALIEILNPNYYEIYKKYIKTMNIDSNSPFLDNLFSFQFFGTLPEKHLDSLKNDNFYSDDTNDFSTYEEELNEDNILYEHLEDDEDEFIN